MNIIYKSAKPKFFIPVFLLSFALQGYMLIVVNPILLSFSGNLNPLDLKMGYSMEYATQFLHSLGEHGRNIYLNKFIFVDWFFSLISGFAWASFLIWMYRISLSSMPNLQRLGVIPLFITFFDYIENICSVIMIQNYPDISISVSNFGSVSGIIKMILFYITILQILFLVVLLVKKRILK